MPQDVIRRVAGPYRRLILIETRQASHRNLTLQPFLKEPRPIMAKTLTFTVIGLDGSEERCVQIKRLIIAGWTGRNKAAMEAHIEELAALGIPRPARTPIFYRVAANRLTTDSEIEATGDGSSGEAEFFLFNDGGERLVGTASDHTDRKAEVHGVTLSKQMCEKPVAQSVWRLQDLADHWSSLELHATIGTGEEQTVYQQGSVTAMLSPEDLLQKFAAEDPAGGFQPGDLMLCGTLPVIGGVRPSNAFQFKLVDPVLNRALEHRYSIIELPDEG